MFEFWNQMFSDSPGFSDRIDGFEVFDSYMDDAQAWVMKMSSAVIKVVGIRILKFMAIGPTSRLTISLWIILGGPVYYPASEALFWPDRSGILNLGWVFRRVQGGIFFGFTLHKPSGIGAGGRTGFES
ncbi:MAG: hypothetical protein DWI24_05685 [Planctomycetota bacterium]|nr:MAG: hypothetical protein DWI24_05685 [Planctomycetota bacterium]